jgi:hypothetical protein
LLSVLLKGVNRECVLVLGFPSNCQWRAILEVQSKITRDDEIWIAEIIAFFAYASLLN